MAHRGCKGVTQVRGACSHEPLPLPPATVNTVAMSRADTMGRRTLSKSKYKFTYLSLRSSIYQILHPLSSSFHIQRLRSWRHTVLKITQDVFKKPLLVLSSAPLDQDIQVIEDTPYAIEVESRTHWVAPQHNLSCAHVSYR